MSGTTKTRWRRFGITLIACWTSVLALFFYAILHTQHVDAIDKALHMARDYYALNIEYRKWNADLGGVYAPAEKVTPNPHLLDPARDVLTQDGRKLTLINPAYMTRMVFESLNKSTNDPFVSRLVSLKPLNPSNSADDWERKALLQFERSEIREVNELVTQNGQPYLKFISAFVTKENCLKCHASQGYKTGDIRGGMSITIPLSGYLTGLDTSNNIVYLCFFILWISGSAAIAFSSDRRFRRDVALEKSEQKYRELVEHANSIILRWTSDGKIIFLNEFGLKFFGYSAEELIGQHVVGTIVPENESTGRDMKPLMEQILADPHSFEQNVNENILKNGERVWIAWTNKTVLDERGEVSEVLSIGTDITERKRSVEALRKSEEHYRAMIDAFDGFMYICSRDFRIEFMNRKLIERTGYDATGEYCFKALHDRDSTCPWCVNDQVFAGETVNWEVMSPKDNRLYQVANSPVNNGDGTISKQAMITDITDQRLLTEQLRHTQRLDSIGQLAGGIAHDFNNILTVISGYAYLLQEKALRNNTEDASLRHIISAVDRATALTKGLLAFSRKQQMYVQQCNLNNIVSDAGIFLSRLITADISLSTVLSETPLPVKVDTGAIEQIIINLVTNARDAMPNGGKLTITTGTRYLDELYVKNHTFARQGNYALITVSDTGAGMDKETCDKIFDPFFTTKEVGKGTGLGLAIAYGILKQHDGYINVYSELGIGTVFKVYLPLTEGTQSLDTTSMMEKTDLQGNETILVIEDDEEIRNLITTTLPEFGYSIITAVDGEDGIEKFRENSSKIQLVITDVIMPKKSGVEVCAAVKSLCPDMPVILISGYTSDFIADKGGMLKDMTLLLKPLQPMELLTKIRKTLAR